MVSSATPPAPGGSERILDAALDLFGHQGVAATSVRAIAEQAGVSPALVIHHFGSKAKLHEACDDRVVELIHSRKTETIQGGPTLMPGELDVLMRESRPALRYLARTLSDGSPRINQLMDDLIESSIGYTAQAEELGYVKPSANPRARVIVLTLWMFGGLVLHEHMARLLGVDLFDENSDVMPYMSTAMEILTDGVIAETAYQDLRTPPGNQPSH
ncbi:TetR/AcrR family transcriptional regulator [Enemella sp. A6]|uniref:TetR/AcrR family transcriptional regulator n=1 Tax=Enemella sp. A6 TaxID=3440152 RepID=UPI003EBACF65